MTRMDPIDPFRALRETVKRPFTEAMAMPPEVYTSPAFLAAELEGIFRQDWVCIGRASALPNPGDYVTAEIAGQPVVVLRDQSGAIRAMSNVCLHRMSTLLTGSGNTRSIVCPYHAWTYNLDGSLRGAPAMTRNEGFCKEAYRLPQLKVEDWLGWVFVTLNPAADPVAARLSTLAAAIAPFGMETYVEAFREEFTWATNWKVLAENFMESYHLPVCHADTIGALSKLDGAELPPGEPHYNLHFIHKDPSFTLSVAHPTNTTLEGEWRLKTAVFSIYPSLFITLTPGYFWYLSLTPLSPGSVQVLFGGGLSPDFARDPKGPEHFAALKSLLDEVNLEDKGCTEAVFRGLSSRLAAPGHLSPLERPLYDFATYISARVDA